MSHGSEEEQIGLADVENEIESDRDGLTEFEAAVHDLIESYQGKPIAQSLSPFPDLLTPTETAKLLSVELNTLQKWRTLSQGPPYIKLSNKCIRYRRADIEEYIEANTKNAGAKATPK